MNILRSFGHVMTTVWGMVIAVVTYKSPSPRRQGFRPLAAAIQYLEPRLNCAAGMTGAAAQVLVGPMVAGATMTADTPSTVTSKPVTYTITANEGSAPGLLSAADILNPANMYAAPFEILNPTTRPEDFHSYDLFDGVLYAVGQAGRSQAVRFTIDLRTTSFVRSANQLLDDLSPTSTFTNVRATQKVAGAIVSYGGGEFIDSAGQLQGGGMYWGLDGVPHMMKGETHGFIGYVNPMGIAVGQITGNRGGIARLGSDWYSLPEVQAFGSPLNITDDGVWVFGADGFGNAVHKGNPADLTSYVESAVPFQPDPDGQVPDVTRRGLINPRDGGVITFGDTLQPDIFFPETTVHSIGGTTSEPLIHEFIGQYADADPVGSHILAAVNDADGAVFATLDKPDQLTRFGSLLAQQLDLHEVSVDFNGIQYDPSIGVVAVEVIGFDSSNVRHTYLLTYRFSETAGAVTPVHNGKFAIDWDGNGTVDQTVIGDSGLTVTHAFPSSGTFNSKVTVTSSTGTSVGPATAQVVVTPTLMQGNVLLVGGTDQADFVSITSGRGGVLNVRMSGATKTFSGVKSAQVFFGLGADYVQIDAPIIVTVDLGDGNDLALVNASYSTIVGGAGNDYISVQGAQSYVNAGDGNDVLVDFATTSIMVGGNGSDTFIGGNAKTLIVSDNAVLTPAKVDAVLAALGKNKNPMSVLSASDFSADHAVDYFLTFGQPYAILGKEDGIRFFGVLIYPRVRVLLITV